MKEPLEKQLEKMYQIFKMDHERLRKELADSVNQPQSEYDYEPEPETTHIPKRRSSGSSLGEIIMDSRIFKIAAAIIIVGLVAIGLKVFTGTDSITSVALGDVIQKIHNSSYTFDMTFIEEGQSPGKYKCMMLQPGILRTDTQEILGVITSILNCNTGDRIWINHSQKTVINLKDAPNIVEDANDIGPFAMFTNPIETLWNLKDDTETVLKEKEIAGQSAIGFKVVRDDEKYPGDIIVWANNETGAPLRVEINLYNPENNSVAATIVLDKFNLDAELDPELFSMETPEGYTLAYQNTLEEMIQKGESSPEADKIALCIELWSNSEEDKAIQTLLSIDWAKPFIFSGDMYLFYWKESDFVKLKQADQQIVGQQSGDTMSLLRKMCFKICEDAQAEISNQQYSKAEQYLTATLELGKLINRDPELAYTVQMFGHALIQKSLAEMEKLYEAWGQQEKLQQTQEDIKEMEAEVESFREIIKNMTRG